jgi:hypothetical protein
MQFDKSLIRHKFLTKDNIRNHFIGNPEWEQAFAKHYSIDTTTPKNYPQRTYDVLIKNGYEIEEIRPYKSDRLKMIVHFALYKDGEWLIEYADFNEANAFEQLICQISGNYDLTYKA